jgi:hypothetical protein
MKRIALTALVGIAFVAAAPSAQAAEGPCAQQRALFEKYNIQFDMHAPLVEWAYGEACSRTDSGASARAAAAPPSPKDILDDLIVCVMAPCP